MKKLIRATVAVVFSFTLNSVAWGHNLDPDGLCELPGIKYESCEVKGFGYDQDSEFRHAKLIKLFLGRNAGVHCCGPDHYNNIFYLYTHDERLLDLGGFKQQPSPYSLSCLADSLSIDFAKAGGQISYKDYKSFSHLKYVLEDGQLYAVYVAKDPYEGEIRTTNGKDCIGNLGFKKQYISWAEANSICAQRFSKDVGYKGVQNRQTVYIREDAFDYFYLCRMQRTLDATKGDLEFWFYRLNMSKENNPSPLLIGKKVLEGSKTKGSPPPKPPPEAIQ